MVKPLHLLPLLVALALCGCQSVQSKNPVGNKVAELKPAILNAEWQDGEGQILKSKIKDARLGIVELTPVAFKPKPGEPKNYDILVRTLGPHLIANTNQMGNKPAATDPYLFGRLVIDETHLLVFPPEPAVFSSLIKRHRITGTLDRDKHGKPTGSCVLASFSEQQYQSLKNSGFDTRSLFNEDPVYTFIRYTPR